MGGLPILWKIAHGTNSRMRISTHFMRDFEKGDSEFRGWGIERIARWG